MNQAGLAGASGIKILEAATGMNDPKLVAQSKAGVLRAMQQFALEQSVEESVKVTSESESAGRQICSACGSPNRKGNSFCANCGVPLQKAPEGAEIAPANPSQRLKCPAIITTIITITTIISPAARHGAGGNSRSCRSAGGGAGSPARDLARVRTPLGGASHEPGRNRSPQDHPGLGHGLQHETAGRPGEPLCSRCHRAAAECSMVRGAAAIREFFFGLLDAGMSEVEMDPQRAELFGDYGYETGRCKSLVPSAAGKRREERGKYLVLLNRQANGEWKIVADSWSSDLSLGGGAEPPVKAGVAPGTAIPGLPRKP